MLTQDPFWFDVMPNFSCKCQRKNESKDQLTSSAICSYTECFMNMSDGSHLKPTASFGAAWAWVQMPTLQGCALCPNCRPTNLHIILEFWLGRLALPCPGAAASYPDSEYLFPNSQGAYAYNASFLHGRSDALD